MKYSNGEAQCSNDGTGVVLVVLNVAQFKYRINKTRKAKVAHSQERVG